MIGDLALPILLNSLDEMINLLFKYLHLQFKGLSQLPDLQKKEEYDRREKLVQLYTTLIAIFIALQTVTTNITYKVDSTNLSNILISQTSNDPDLILKFAYSAFIICILGYYILLRTHKYTNWFAFFASLSFSISFCYLIGFANLILSSICAILLTFILFLSLQTWFVLEELTNRLIH